MLARIAEFVIDVEEHLEPDSHNVSADSPSFGVPETNRIHCLSLNVDKDRGIVWLRYNRKTMETQGEISDSSDPLKRWRINSTILAWKDSTAESVEIVDPE
jgi:hypothetical protein